MIKHRFHKKYTKYFNKSIDELLHYNIMTKTEQLDDMDYIRALIEIDAEVAIQIIPGLRTPKVGYYYFESNCDGITLKLATCLREELIKLISENKINIIGIMSNEI